MEQDGTPGELLLPWRTTALMLGGAKYLGAVDLPGGSPNAVFARRGDAVMVIWNPRPQDEPVYLGPNIRQVDLWGRMTQPAERKGGQRVRADRLPTFVVGMSEPLFQWQLAFALARQQMPAVPLQPMENSFRLKNTFADAVDVQVRLTAPDGWLVEPKEFSLHLPGGAESRQSFRVTLPDNALSGRQTIRGRLRDSGRPRVSLPCSIGRSTWDSATWTWRRPPGSTTAANWKSARPWSIGARQPVSFRCGLYAPDRCRQPSLVVGLVHGPDVQVYRLPNGRELLGKTLWVRAEEVDGPRVFNCRVTVPGKEETARSRPAEHVR